MKKLISIIFQMLTLNILFSLFAQAENVTVLKERAETGDPQAQFELASEYHKNKNYKAAYRWLHDASKKGHPKAQLNLSSLYFNGEGVSQNVTEGVKWLAKAGDQGERQAQIHLNILYHQGNQVPRNYKKAAYWAEKAALQGHAESQYILAVYYDSGDGVAQSDESSAKWFKEAAEQGHMKAKNRLGMAYLYGIGVEKNIESSIKWNTIPANNGDYYSQSFLVIAYEESPKRDEYKLNYWSKMVAKSKNIDLMFMLSQYYFSINNNYGFENSYTWAYLMIENGAKAQKMIEHLTKRLSAEAIERAENKAKYLRVD